MTYEQTIDVTWGDCDLAGLVYFPKILDYCHRALEGFFGGLEGGYAELTMKRKIGIPTVHIDGDFTGAIRYGQSVLVQVTVKKVGTTSVTFEHNIVDAKSHEARAKFKHIIAVCELLGDGVKPLPIPHDMKVLLLKHYH